MTRFLIAAGTMLALTAAAHAQAQAPNPFEQGQVPPCVQEFIKLRDVAQKRGEAIQAASKRRADPRELCGLFNTFVGAESKVVKYAEANHVWCGIPPQALEQMKNAHINSQKARSNICKVAAQGPPQPRGPSLGDALGTTPVPNASNVKKGSGTFDTLTGSPLAR
ncbi:MAG: hypothetical protein AB7O50_01415 [Pseudolabrys sp.]